jgi:hypothetical protein
MMEKLSEAKIRVTELEKYGKDRDRMLYFLYDLEKRKIIRSDLELTSDLLRTERVWYPITEKEKS